MNTGTESVAQVQARIAQIESRFAMRRPQALAGSGGTDFASALAAAQSDPTFQTAEVSGARVVQTAAQYLGVPYQWGGTDPATGLDCSGFVQRVYGDLGIELPRVSRDQAKAGRPVADLASAQPGDLIAFDTPVDHIGIYVGNNRMIVAPRTGDVVKIQDVPGDITAIRRILPDAAGASTTPFDRLFESAGARHGISSDILRAVARAESGFRTDAVSPAGAQGLMQLMPSTARGLGVNPFDPAQAIDGAAGILAGNLRKFGSLDKALAAYNAGPGAVQRYGGVPPYAETQNYVRRILTDLRTEAP
jgi:hypothetical protein